jgi:glutamate dehydrogenase
MIHLNKKNQNIGENSVMDRITEASKSCGLSVEELNEITNILVTRGNFSQERIENELYTFCCKIGMVQHYFKTTPIQTIANHIESITAAEIISINRGYDKLEVDFMSESDESAMYLCNDDHEKGIEIERRLENAYSIYRLQSYRTSGIALESHFRSYFVEKPIFPEPAASPLESDINKVATTQFLSTTTQDAINRYQRVLKESLAWTQPYIEISAKIPDEIRIMVAIPQYDSFRFLSGVSDIINHYGQVSKHKYVEPFSNGKLIMSVYLDAESARPYIDDMVTDISLISIHPESPLAPLIRDNSLSVHEAFYALGAWNFTHQFLSSFSAEYMALTNVLKDRPELLDTLHQLRTRLVKDSYTEDRILQTIFRYPEEIKKLYIHFSNRFQKKNNSEVDEQQLNFTNIAHEVDKDVLEYFLLFNKAILKTNFYKKNKVCLAFRLDPTLFLDSIEYKENPYGVFMILAREFRGFHVRFRDIARGGIRIVRSRDPETYDLNSDSIFDENYNLAFTQQRKNKDIPEGGSKGAILLNQNYQNSGDVAFQKYVDGLLDAILPRNSEHDYLKQEEILFLGPDEGTAELMSWASQRAKIRGYKFWKSFSTGKTLVEGGIPHDVYGMTTNSVHENVLGILNKLGLKEEEITKVQTGGPDGDLGSNEILISKDKTLCIIDGSGVLYDPEGIDRTELTRLAKKRVMIEHFDKKFLSPQGFLVHINDTNITLPDGTTVTSGLEFRNSFHLNFELKADFFIPCGGRPNSINIQNWKRLLDENGIPRFKFIVEGANLFLTQSARLALEKKGVIIIKDATANKGGVTSSSLEVLASLALSDEEYAADMCVINGRVPEFRQQYVSEVLDIIRLNARLEFEVLWNERLTRKIPYSILSDQLSNKINQVADSIHNSELCNDTNLIKRVVEKHAPPCLVKKLGIETILKRVPQNYLQAITSSWLGSHFIYQFGLKADEIKFYQFLNKIVK